MGKALCKGGTFTLECKDIVPPYGELTESPEWEEDLLEQGSGQEMVVAWDRRRQKGWRRGEVK